MELFELLGRIAVTGADEANEAIDSVADNAEKNALRICGAFEKIGSSALSYGIEISLPDIQPQENESGFLEGIAQKVKTAVSGGGTQEISADNLWQNFFRNADEISKRFDNIMPIEIFEKAETVTTENYSNTSREESFSENVDTQNILSEFNRNFSNVNREEKLSESFNAEEFFSQINRNFSNFNREERYFENVNFSELLRKVDETFRSITRDERFSESVSTTKSITEFSPLSDKIENIGRIFDAEFSGVIFSEEDVSEQIKAVQKAVEKGMPKVTDAQLSELESLSRKSMQKWEKIGSASAVGIGKMAGGVTQKMPLVTAACDSVAQGAAQALSVDGSASGRYLMETFGNGISQKAWEVYNAVSGIAQNISSIMSGVTFAGISVEASAEAVSVPEYATGGIVTREHIARVGENGAEAIIPLENNTEWIDKVASRMSGNTSNSAVSSKLDEVISLLKNQKIYLDSGQLVGGIANKMDRKLGSMARLKGRG